MLSRVAASVYWLSRYRERAENTARLLDVNLNLMTDAPKEMKDQWQPMIETIGVEEAFYEQYDRPTQENVIKFLTFSLENPSSIFNCMIQARENARSVRDTITSEMWNEINTLFLFIQKTSFHKWELADYDHFFKRVKRQSQLFTGIADTCMVHNEAWYFLRLGNLIERADMATRILDAKYFMLLPRLEFVGTPLDNIQWMALLKSVDAYEMYRKKWHRITPHRVAHFLVLHEAFPRSVFYCLNRIQKSLSVIDREIQLNTVNLAIESVQDLITELSGLSGESIIENGLHEYVDKIQQQLIIINDRIFDRYFALKPLNQST